MSLRTRGFNGRLYSSVPWTPPRCSVSDSTRVARVFLVLPCRATPIHVRAEHAAVPRLRAQHGLTAGAVVEENAPIRGHGFNGAMPTDRTRQCRYERWHQRPFPLPENPLPLSMRDGDRHYCGGAQL